MHRLMKPQQWYSVALVFRREGASGGSSSAGESIGAEQKKGLLFCCSALFIFSRKTCRKKTRQEMKASSECVCMHTQRWHKYCKKKKSLEERKRPNATKQPKRCRPRWQKGTHNPALFISDTTVSHWRQLPFHKSPVKAARDYAKKILKY